MEFWLVRKNDFKLTNNFWPSGTGQKSGLFRPKSSSEFDGKSRININTLKIHYLQRN